MAPVQPGLEHALWVGAAFAAAGAGAPFVTAAAPGPEAITPSG